MLILEWVWQKEENQESLDVLSFAKRQWWTDEGMAATWCCVSEMIFRPTWIQFNLLAPELFFLNFSTPCI